MNLVLSSKSDKKWPKMAKTKIVQKNAYMWHLALRVKELELYKSFCDFFKWNFISI